MSSQHNSNTTKGMTKGTIRDAAAAADTDESSHANNPRIDAIIQKLQKAMMRHRSKNNNQNSSSLSDLLNHLRHCLTVVQAKTTSLELALHCLLHEIWPQFVTAVLDQCSNSNNKNASNTLMQSNISTLAYHFFMQLLRLHDGHILCESGECRHAGDVAMAARAATKNGHASQLNRIGNSSTNSTTATTATTSSSRLYRPDAVYSGASWDELMNETVGIWHRLQQQHASSSTSRSEMDWEDFVDERVPELNALMNEIENCKTRNQKAFGTLMERINLGRQVLEMQQQQKTTTAAAACRITMRVNLRDKMEEFSLQIVQKGGSSAVLVAVTLQRRASAFQWKDPLGVLPMGYSARDWSTSLALPKLLSSSASSSLPQEPSQATTLSAVLAQNKSKKRRRRVILDDDDDSSSSTCHDDEKRTIMGQENSNINQNTKLSKVPKSSTIQPHPHPSDTTGAAGTGLLVKVDAATRGASKSQDATVGKGGNNKSVSNNTTSLMEIKKQSGVDVQALEEACLVVQAEEAETKRQAMAVDLMILDDNVDGDDAIENIIHDADEMMLDGDNDDAEIRIARQQARLKVKHFRLQLKKMLRKHSGKLTTTTTTFTKTTAALDEQGYHPPEYEVWDVRENLRLALMEAGNRNLFDETSADEPTHQQRHACLQQAMKYFAEAAECVVEQQSLYKTMMANHDDDDARVAPNLFFLLAQALTNKGIAFLELANHVRTTSSQQAKQDSSTDKNERQYLRDAIHTLELSLQQLQTFKTQSSINTKTMLSEEEQETVLFDLLQGQELESLTHRTMACAFWHQGLHSKAAERFRIAGSLRVDEEDGTAKSRDGEPDGIDHERVSSSRELLEAELLVRIECFYAWTRLADLGNAFLESSMRRSRLADSDQAKAKAKDEKMYSIVLEALRNALSASKAIHEKVQQAPSFVAQHLQVIVSERDVQTPQDLEQFLADSPEWWRKRQEELSRLVEPLIPREEHQRQLLLPRNDVDARLTADNITNGSEPPKRRFVFTSDGAHRKKKKQPPSNGGGGMGHVTTGTHASTAIRQTQPHKFRPWGDELLPQLLDEMSGQMVPQLPAVCLAPIMPPEIAAMIRAQRQS